MKINFKKKRFYLHLTFGLLWILLSFVRLLTEGKTHWSDLGFLIVGLSYFGIYYYEKSHQYLTIENGNLIVNKPYGRKINLKEIKEIKKFGGDYILKTDLKEMVIYTEIIDPNSLRDLNVVLNKLTTN